MGLVYSSFTLLHVLCAAENVELPLLLNRAQSPGTQLKTKAALNRAGLAHHWYYRCHKLFGEQQSVAIGRAPTGRPRLVWADESIASLRTPTAIEDVKLAKRLHIDGVNLVLATHNLAFAARTRRRTSMGYDTVTKKFLDKTLCRSRKRFSRAEGLSRADDCA